MSNLSKLSNRLLSLLMAVMMILSMMPMGVSVVNAAPTDATEKFSITVKNTKNDFLSDIKVSYKILVNDEEYVSDEGKTKDGIILIPEIDDIRDSQTTGNKPEIKISALLSGVGFDNCNLEEQIIEEDTDNIDIVMTEKEKVSVSLEVKDSNENLISNADVLVDGYSTITGKTKNEKFICSLYKGENYKITVTKSGYKSYSSEETVFDKDNDISIIMNSKAADNTFAFAKTEKQTIIYGNNSFVNAASSQVQRSGIIKYSVKTGESVSVNSSTGEITTLKAGISEINATMAEDEDYVESVASYTIEVKPAAQSGFYFDNPSPDNITYDYQSTYTNIASGGEGTGSIEYSISGTAATIDSATGVLSIKKAGEVTVTAKKAADDKYEEVSASYSLTIEKAEQKNFTFTDPSPKDVFVTEKKYVNDAVGGNGEGAITYEIIEGSEYATIDDPTSSTVTLMKVGGPVTVRATKKGNSGYNDATAQYRFSVIKADQSEMRFETSEPDPITYSPDGKYANKLIEGKGTGAVKYKIDGDAAEINEDSGVLSLIKSGTVTVTATKASDNNYEEKSVSYTLTINKADQTAFAFIDGSQVVKTWKPNDNIYTNTAVGGQSTGDVSYSVSGSVPEMPYGDPCITFDEENAAVTMNGKGIVKIKAVRAGDDCYNAVEAEYTLTINRSEQDTLTFDTTIPDNVTYNENDNIIPLSVIGGSDDGAVSYYLESGDAVAIRDNKAYISRSGEVEIKAVKAETNRYEEACATLRIKIEKAEQYIEFENKTITSLVYGTSLTNAAHEVVNTSVPDKKGHSDSTIIYDVTEGKNIASVDENGKLSFQNNAVGKVTVKASKSGDDCYNDSEASYTVVISFAEIPDVPYTLSGETKNGSGWYTDNVTIKPSEGYLISESNALLGNDWAEELTIDTENKHPMTIYLKKDNAITAPVVIDEDKIRIDKTFPVDLSISYSDSVMDTILEFISFGFYQSSVTVTIEAADNVSHIDSFVYKIGDKEATISKDDITFSDDGISASAQFTIEPQYRGRVSFTAYDTAGNHSEKYDDKVIVVDNIAPGVTVSFDNNDAHNGNYYSADRTATITVDEAEFFYEFFGTDEITQHLIITVIKENDDGTKTTKIYKNEELDVPFNESEPNSGIWEGKIEFKDNADYTLTIECTDFSDNKAETYSTSFTIDKIAPEISISYDDKLQETGYSKEICNAQLTVVEHNFRASDLSIENISAVDVQGNSVDIFTDYESMIKSEHNWTSEGDVHKIIVPFDTDAKYSFKITCSDLAGNEQEEAIESGLTVDKTAPVNLKVTYSSSVINTILKNLTFGFYDAPVTVTVIADDLTSGVEFFTCAYEVQVGESSVNVGHDDFILSGNDITFTEGDKTATASFEIPQQFRGSVSFTATDRAGNTSNVFKDSKVIVVDDIAPEVTVRYDPAENQSDYEGYYNADRSATITIAESNFFEESFEKNRDLNISELNDLIDEHLIINVTKIFDDGRSEENRVKSADLKTKFKKTGEDLWIATVLFNENADYTWEIIYKDFSGNEAGRFTDSFTIDKLKPEITVSYDNIDVRNGDHYRSDRKATITVKEHNFNPVNILFSCTAKDIQGNNVDFGKDYQELLRNAKWTHSGNVHTAEIDFDVDARYNYEMHYADMAGNTEKKTLTDEFCIDKLSPALSNMNVSYSNSIVDIVLQSITFGFYKAPVTVTISGDDLISGIDYFTYSYTVSAGESKKNHGKSNIVVPSSEIKYSDYGRHSAATFTIPPQFRGDVSFMATDRAGNESELFTDEKCVVTDNVIPGLSVKYDNNSAKNGGFYRSSRTATIKINEANFFTEAFDKNHLIIKVTSVSNDGDYKTVNLKNDDLTVPFRKVSEDTWSAKLLFDKDADYKWSIEYKDFSGNSVGRFSDTFTVDKTNPEIEVIHYNNDVKNGRYFNAKRVADIVITEHNFKAQDVKVTVKTTKATGKVTDYQKLLSDPANWKTSGDVHTARISFNTEAKYTFDIEYKDLAGRKNNPVNYGASAAPKKFTVDKTAPTKADITINGSSVVAKKGVTFEKFYRKAVDISFSVNSNISGINNIRYQKVSSVNAYSEDGIWEEYNNKVTVSPDEKFVIYFRAEDNAGNYTIVNSIGIVVDRNAPVGNQFAPEIDIVTPKANKNNLYNSDVAVNIVVVDPGYKGSAKDKNGFYSGLNKISYRIYAKDINSSEAGVLFDLASGSTSGGEKDTDDLIKKWSGKIVIDSEKFNSNNVVVEITAEDNAGNKRTTTNDMLNVPIGIDITPPQISVSYNNNDGDKTFTDSNTDAYFKADRIAKIVITERNFNADDVNILINHEENVSISGWSSNTSSGNGDGTTHTATITYSVDEDYTFDIDYTDKADNKNTQVNYNNSLAPQKFTVDKTAPKFSVTYDNNEKQNGNYYKSERTATLRVEEHNFEESRIKVILSASDNGVKTTVPSISKWTSNGDVHTATVKFSNDSYYTLDFEYADKAGNKTADFDAQKFYIDNTDPIVSISEISDEYAYNDKGNIGYTITATDTNFDLFEPVLTAVVKNSDGFEIKQIDAGKITNIENGQVYKVDNLDTDGIYKITCSVKDKAGREYSKITLYHQDGTSYVEDRSGMDTLLSFSVNRNGSTYELDEHTMELLGHYYVQNVTDDVVITEVNADPLEEYKITVNDKALSKDMYSVEKTDENEKWHKMVYTIDKSVFQDEGEYTVVAASTDKATNNAFSDVKGQEIRFVVDRTAPVVTITGLAEDGRYQTDVQTVTIVPTDDGGALKSIVVSLVDDNGRELKQLLSLSDGDFIEALDKGNGQLTFQVSEGLYQNVKITCDDDAYCGDGENIMFNTTITNVSVTSSAFLIFWANKPLRWGVIAGVVAVIALSVFIIVKVSKRKKRST